MPQDEQLNNSLGTTVTFWKKIIYIISSTTTQRQEIMIVRSLRNQPFVKTRAERELDCSDYYFSDWRMNAINKLWFTDSKWTMTQSLHDAI